VRSHPLKHWFYDLLERHDMRSSSSTVWTACALMLLGLASTAQAAATREKAAQASEAAEGVQMVPTGKGYGVPAAPGQIVHGSQTPDGFGIDYHGGPVMKAKGGQKIYILWYGDWATQSPTGKAIIHDMINNITGTPYYNINTTYYQDNNTAKNVKNKVALKGEADDVAYSQGKALSDTQIRTLISGAITSGKFPADKNGIYYLLTTKDVNATSGFCTAYCGWHTHKSVLSTDIKYSFVGDAARCIGSCAAQNTSPNDNPGVDGMASVIMHEMEETASDPDLNAWWQTSTGMENADKCAWTFGTELTAPNGSKYNVQWGPRKFLIQRNWVNVAPAGKCDLQI